LADEFEYSSLEVSSSSGAILRVCEFTFLEVVNPEGSRHEIFSVERSRDANVKELDRADAGGSGSVKK